MLLFGLDLSNGCSTAQIERYPVGIKLSRTKTNIGYHFKIVMAIGHFLDEMAYHMDVVFSI